MGQGKKASDFKRKPVPRTNVSSGFGVQWFMPPELMSNSTNSTTPAYSLGVN